MEYGQQDQAAANGYRHVDDANERQLPKRMRGMLDEIRSHGQAWLQHSLRRTLINFEQQLFTQAEQARDPAEQHHCFDSRMLLQAGRREFEAAFHEAIQRNLQALDGAVHRSATSAHGIDQPMPLPCELSLVDPIEQERRDTLDKLAARAESRHGRALFELGYRFAALHASAPLGSEQLPFGPRAITHALERAIAALPSMHAVHRVKLLNAFDGGLMAELEPLYHAINERLIARGILSHLRAFPPGRSGQHVSVNRMPSATNPEASAGHAANSVRHEVPTTSRGDRATTDKSRSDSIAVLDELRELLARQRTHPAVAANGHITTPDELQTALDALQKHRASVASHAAREIRSAQALREEILRQLNSKVPPGNARRQLSLEQGDMVDLVAMLFQQLGQEVAAYEQAKSVLGGLQLPTLRLALEDCSFINTRDHPVRKLLNAVAETTQYWLQADGQTDHTVAAQLMKLVERANREAPSTSLYLSLLADIEHQLDILARKAQLAERRHIEAMQGRERLDQARQRASLLMAKRFMNERLDKHHPRGLTRVLLEHAWTDVLALSLLRNGEDSTTFVQRLRLTDQLFGALPITDRAATQAQIEQGLQQIGMQAEEARQVALRLLGSANHADHTAAAESLPPATDLAIRIKQRTRLGKRADKAATSSHAATAAITDAPNEQATTTAHAPDTGAKESGPPLTAAEHAMLRHLQQLPFGTWFTVLDKDGKRSERKLSWFSPVSGHCLLVSRRGLRAEDLSMQEMARELASGRMQEVLPGHGNLLDQAWDRLTAHLRRLGLSERHGGAA